ncbi:MAG: N-acetylmuramate alpha-1-phosphate uridylyltransferase MurU [Aestuariibacter sp.]
MSGPSTAMILAAGRGERMMPLTDHTPKPLLQVRGRPLISYHLDKLAALGYDRVVINHAWLGEKIEKTLGDGSQFGLQIVYSAEKLVLETAGGIAKALPLLGNKPFLVVNGDVWSDFDFGLLNALPTGYLAQLVMVENPEHHPAGDFVLSKGDIRMPTAAPTNPQPDVETYTFSGMALYDPAFFANVAVEKQALAPILKQHIANGRVSGILHSGQWCDVGTPQRLAALNQE